MERIITDSIRMEATMLSDQRKNLHGAEAGAQTLLRYANQESSHDRSCHTNLKVHVARRIPLICNVVKLTVQTQTSEDVVQDEGMVILTDAAYVSPMSPGPRSHANYS